MKTFTLLSLLAVMTLGVIVFVGCETESADAPVHINPAAATVLKGESVTFTASGGYDYKWSLSNNEIGHLSTSTGKSTVYTSLSDTDNQQTLTLTSTIDGTSTGTSTNTFSYAQTTTAVINHIESTPAPEPKPDPDPDPDSVSINPSSATITSGNTTINFNAIGNGSNYKWSISNPSIGSLSSLSGNSTVYTGIIPASGTNSQKVTLIYNAPDGSMNSKTATVTQKN